MRQLLWWWWWIWWRWWWHWTNWVTALTNIKSPWNLLITIDQIQMTTAMMIKLDLNDNCETWSNPRTVTRWRQVKASVTFCGWWLCSSLWLWLSFFIVDLVSGSSLFEINAVLSQKVQLWGAKEVRANWHQVKIFHTDLWRGGGESSWSPNSTDLYFWSNVKCVEQIERRWHCSLQCDSQVHITTIYTWKDPRFAALSFCGLMTLVENGRNRGDKLKW